MDNPNIVLKEQYDNLPATLQAIISNPTWRKMLDEKAKSFGLNDDQRAFLENEVVFVLTGLEPKESFAKNIKNELSISEEDSRKISDYVNGSIFSNITQEIKSLWTESEKEVGGGSVQETKQQSTIPPKPEQPRARVAPVGFEEAILNQARAMRVATPPPSNLPTAPEHNVHDYKQGADPYREPLE